MAEVRRDGSIDGREPVVLSVQPRTAHSGESSFAPDQSGRDPDTDWAWREAGAIL